MTLTENQKKDICKWAGQDDWYAQALINAKCNVGIDILIKAMWSINREGKWSISLHNSGIYVKRLKIGGYVYFIKHGGENETEFLQSALAYVSDKMREGE